MLYCCISAAIECSNEYIYSIFIKMLYCCSIFYQNKLENKNFVFYWIFIVINFNLIDTAAFYFS